MKKTLLATSAMVLAGAMAAGSALAADMMGVSVGGYMQQWIGITSLDNGSDNDGGVTQYSDSEIYFKGSLEADNGLKFSVKVEMEGNTHGDQIDESQATVSGSFGQIVLGSEDHPAALMHYGNQDVGVGLACGDAGIIKGISGCALEGGKGLGTNGWIIGGDDHKIAYYTPRMSGVQFGAAYIPNTTNEDRAGAPENNDNNAWSVGLNYQGGMGDASVAASFGHYQANQVGSTLIAQTEQEALDGNVGNLGPIRDRIAERAMKVDAETFTNFGLRVGIGSFGFDVAYATHDGGEYMAVADPSKDIVVDDDAVSIVKNTSRDYDVMSAGLKYSDGPMAVSLSHMMADADDGTDTNVTMLSMSYNLAPGIASRTSLFAGEQGMAEGTAFVTGITLGF